ncbi:hypothetical protein FRC06_004578, partial [Ceratobasidium sp. 370]
SGVPAAQGTPHPIAWIQEYEAGGVASSDGAGVVGRSFYSSLGHLNQTWQNPVFMKHVLGGLTWTFGSNTTRVAAGLYGGTEPTVHTGATSSNPGTVGNWHPVLGSNQAAPPPPAQPVTPTPSASASGPDATAAAGSGGSSSGALANVSVPRGLLWAIAAALVGASTL